MTTAKIVQLDESLYRGSELVTVVISPEAKPFILDGTPETLDEYIVDGRPLPFILMYMSFFLID
jgi:hypothetical protein